MKPTVLGLFIAALAFAASTVYLSVQLREERGQADKLVEATRALNLHIAALEKARAEPRFAVAGAFGVSATQPVRVPINPPAMSEQKTDPVPQVAGGVMVNRQPPGKAFIRMIRSQARAKNKRMYADVGAELGLSKEEADKLIELITDQQTAGFAAASDLAGAEQGRLRIAQSRHDDQAELVDLIGAGRVQALEEYQKTIPARQELEALARQLEGMDAGLNEDQRKRMLAVLVEEQERGTTPGSFADNSPEEAAKKYAEWQDDYNERVSSQARSILTSEQLTAYNEYQQWQKEIRAHLPIMRPTRVVPGEAAVLSFSTAASAMAADSTLLVPQTPAEKPRLAR